MIVDAHQHFWALERGDYAWLTPQLGVLHRDYGPDDLLPLLAAHGVDATVLVQAAPTEAETYFLFDLAKHHAFVAGVVGWTDFAAPEAAERIAMLVAAGAGKLKGLRPMIQDIADPAWLLRDDLDAAFAALTAHDLAFDALIKPAQMLPLLARLRRHQDLRAVIDHAGKPDIAYGGFDAWAQGIAQLAGESGAYCKLSGLLTEAGDKTSFDDIAPYVAHVFDCFGAQRVIWGSDWPVLNLAGDYAHWLDLARALVRGLAHGQEDSVFAGNARRFYRLAAA